MNKKRKILFLGDINSIHLLKWIIAVKDEFEVRVCSLDPNENSHPDFNISDIKVISTSKKLTASSNKLSYLRSFRLFKKEYSEFAPDIVHAHYASSYGLLGAFLSPKRFFVSVWGSDVFEFPKRSILHRSLYKIIMSRADRIFSTSRAMALEINNYTTKDVTVIPFGVDVQRFQVVNKEKNQLLIGTLKSLEKIYGIDILIKATKIVVERMPDVKCHIYGRGSQEASLRKLIHDLDLSDNIELKGYISNNNASDALATFDVFCALSREESFGVSVIEASAASVPVVVSNVGGLPEVVIDQETGIIVDKEDYQAAADAILMLLENQSLRDSMGYNGRDFVTKNYNWNANVESMKSYYN